MVAAPVPVQPVRPLDGGTQREQGGRREVDIEQAVVVIVEDGHARAVGGREMLLVGHARKVHEIDAGFLGDLGEPKRARRELLAEHDRARDDRHAIAGDARDHLGRVRLTGAGLSARAGFPPPAAGFRDADVSRRAASSRMTTPSRNRDNDRDPRHDEHR